MKIRGRAHRFGDDVNTDYIIAAQHKVGTLDFADMATHAFEDIDPDFASRVRPGDLVVAGKNFGCGSSREAAVRVLTELGVAAILAESFARIYFRNAINSGLPALECETSGLEQGDDVEVVLERSVAIDHSRGLEVATTALPAVMRDVLAAGGMGPYFRRHGDLVVPRSDARDESRH